LLKNFLFRLRDDTRFNRFPLFLWVSSFFICGLFWGDFVSARILAVVCVVLIFALIFLFLFCSKKYLFFAGLVCVISFVSGVIRLNIHDAKLNLLGNVLLPYTNSKKTIELKGRVVSFPQIKDDKTKRAKFYFSSYSPVKAKFAVHMTIEEESFVPRFGDQISMEARLYLPSRYRLNRTITYREYLYFHGISFIAKTDSGKCALIARRGFFSFLNTARQKMLDNLNAGDNISEESQYVKAMVFGERLNLAYYMVNRLSELGMIHILVVSGLHVGCLAFVLVTFFQFLGLKKRYAELLLVPVLLFYLFLVGFGVSIVRAVLTVFFYIFAGLLNRERKPEYAILFAGLLQLIFIPRLIYDAGFQYSYLAVMALIFVYPVLARDVSKRGVLARYAVTSLAVWMVISPFSAYRQGVFYAFGFVSGALVVFIADVVVIAGMFASVAGFVSGFLAQSINYFNVVMINLILFLSDLFYEKIPIRFYFAQINYIFLILYLILIGWILLYIPNKRLQVILISLLFLGIVAVGIIL